MTVGIREIGRRLRSLETRPAPEVTYTPEQWARLSDNDLDTMAELPANADGTWDVDRWTDEQHAFADIIHLKAMEEGLDVRSD